MFWKALASCVILASANAGLGNPQDAAPGDKVFAACRGCHQVGPNARNTVGPMLNGIIGRPAGTIPGYTYSAANKNSGLTWDETTFTTYIQNPQGVLKGTKMSYTGLKDAQKIKDLTAFLRQYDASGNTAQ